MDILQMVEFFRALEIPEMIKMVEFNYPLRVS